jgi:hypothetical protein
MGSGQSKAILFVVFMLLGMLLFELLEFVRHQKRTPQA